jgi:hypothetical protein
MRQIQHSNSLDSTPESLIPSEPFLLGSGENPLLEEIRAWIREQLPPSSSLFQTHIKGLWGIRCNFQPAPAERRFSYNIVLAQTSGQGICYYPGSELENEFLLSLVGQKYDGDSVGNSFVDIALLDSLAASLSSTPRYTIDLSGSCRDKAYRRAEIINHEVLSLGTVGSISRKPRVALVGVVSLLVQVMLASGFDVTASDGDTKIIGQRLFSRVEVLPPSRTLSLVADADIAVVTGMTLATNTLGDILETASRYSTKIIIFSHTGASFAPFYVLRGASVVVSEPFPFYTFDGPSRISVFRDR